jgi:hypothetical protein
MDNQTVLLICSLIFNIGLMVERTFTRIRRSDCWGAKIEMNSHSPTNNDIEAKPVEMKQITTNI